MYKSRRGGWWQINLAGILIARALQRRRCLVNSNVNEGERDRVHNLNVNQRSYVRQRDVSLFLDYFQPVIRREFINYVIKIILRRQARVKQKIILACEVWFTFVLVLPTRSRRVLRESLNFFSSDSFEAMTRVYRKNSARYQFESGTSHLRCLRLAFRERLPRRHVCGKHISSSFSPPILVSLALTLSRSFACAPRVWELACVFVQVAHAAGGVGAATRVRVLAKLGHR